jgi:hypothetical protein
MGAVVQGDKRGARGAQRQSGDPLRGHKKTARLAPRGFRTAV